MANSTEKTSLLGKILFVVGIVVILVILAFLIISFVPRAIGGLANVGSSIGNLFGGNDISVTTTNSVVQSGDRVGIAWNHKTNNPGSYGISYQCTDDVDVKILSNNGSRTLVCGSVFTLGPNVKEVIIEPTLDLENGFADVPVQVYFTETGNTSPSANGQVFITVQNGDPNAGIFGGDSTIDAEPVENVDDEDTSDTTTDTDDDDTVYVDTPTTGGPYYVVDPTPADLAVTNVFASGRQVTFTISNVGGTRTGVWVFNYTTPTNPKETITSPLQIPLGPGQAIRYTVTFGEKDSGSQVVTITADPFNGLSELSEANNIGSVTMTGGSFGDGSGSNNGGYDSRDDADFVIEDLEVGRISGSRFIEDDTAEEGDDVAVQFVVRNRGGETTDDWRFEIEGLPYNDDDDYRSREYDRLRPGEYIVVTVEFEDVDDGNYDIEVTVDSEDDTDEESESNNDDSVDLDVDRD